MVTVSLIGELGLKFGSTWRLDIHSPGEAIRAIASQMEEFADYLARSTHGYEIIIDGYAIDESEFSLRIGQTLSIVPVLIGSGAVGRIIVGAAILGLSFLVPAAGFLGVSSTTIGLFGLSMITGGIVELLSPAEKGSEESFLADANGVTRAIQGNPVPVLFGQRFINPVPVSFWVDNENIPVDFQT